jgi:excisionase family DNA binding protein
MSTGDPARDLSPLADPKEVAGLLRVSTQTVRRKAKSGALPAYRIGGRYRFKLGEILAWRDANKIEAKA